MRELPAVLVMLLVGTAMCVCASRPIQPEANASDPTDDESIEVRFARAHLELARLDLRRATERNKRIPNLLPDAIIETLRLHVTIDEAQLEHCLKGEGADSHQTCIRSAEAEVRIAEADVTRKRALHERMPTADTAFDVERAAVVAKIANLNLARTQDLEDSEAALKHLQWQIDQLRHQVLELQLRRQ